MLLPFSQWCNKRKTIENFGEAWKCISNDTVHIRDLEKLSLVELTYGVMVLGLGRFLLMFRLLQKVTLASKVVQVEKYSRWLLLYLLNSLLDISLLEETQKLFGRVSPFSVGMSLFVFQNSIPHTHTLTRTYTHVHTLTDSNTKT